jgi:Caspase domain
MAPSRSGLIIASDTFEDPRLRQLRAPGIDAQELADVLGDSGIGGFDVRVSMNKRHYEVRIELEDFFDDRAPDDVLLLHFSCHGIKDEAGRLFFAVADTQKHRLNATAIAADYVNDLLNRTRSRRVVLLLDCCFSGAFTRGMLARGDDTVDVQERFQGRGRAVLTATSALEYAWEGDMLERLTEPSIFTSAVVRGLRSGEADRDGDRLVSVDDLYDYVFEQVRRSTPNQTPGKWSNVEGMLVIARSARAAALVRDPEPPPAPDRTPQEPPRVEPSPTSSWLSARWLPALIVAVGWIATWLVGFTLAASPSLSVVLPSAAIAVVAWCIAAPATAVALRWAAPELATRRLVWLGVGWPVCMVVGLGVPLATRLSVEGAALLGLGVVGAGVLAAVALIPAPRAIAWDRVAVVVAGWSAGWLVSGATTWPLAFALNERGYYGTFPALVSAMSLNRLLAGAVLSAVVGCTLAAVALPRAEDAPLPVWQPRTVWLPALVVACGWIGAWLAALMLARSDWIADVTASVVLILVTWIIAAALTAAALRWAAPELARSRLALLAVGWPICIFVGIAAPLLLRLSSDGTILLAIGVIAAGVLAGVVLSPGDGAVSWRNVLVVAGGWCAAWAVVEGAVQSREAAGWPQVFSAIASGATLRPELTDSVLVGASVGAVLSAIVGCSLALPMLVWLRRAGRRLPL